MEALLKLASENGFEAVDLQVRSDNLRAVRLYEKMGFEKLFEYSDYFKINGEYCSVLFMCRKIID